MLNLLTTLLLGIWSIATSLYVIIGVLVSVMQFFFEVVEVAFNIITDPGLIIMIILTCVNFYAAAAGTRKEVVGRYMEGFKKSATALVWFITKVVEMVMWLIEAIIDII